MGQLELMPPEKDPSVLALGVLKPLSLLDELFLCRFTQRAWAYCPIKSLKSYLFSGWSFGVGDYQITQFPQLLVMSAVAPGRTGSLFIPMNCSSLSFGCASCSNSHR